MSVTTHLKRPTRIRRAGPHLKRISIWPCSRWGLPCRSVLPRARCALTAPFHPYLLFYKNRRYIFCGTVRELTLPRRYLAPCPMEPGLSSRHRIWRATAELAQEESIPRKRYRAYASLEQPLSNKI